MFGRGGGLDLNEMGVDAVVVCGCTTTGCLLAAVDGCGVSLRRVVVCDHYVLVDEVGMFDVDVKHREGVGETQAVSKVIEVGCEHI